MHLLSPFSLNLPLYEHKKRPSYCPIVDRLTMFTAITCTWTTEANITSITSKPKVHNAIT